ncbi:hypothetical protein [Daejeonia sp. YH14]|uniref:hypothetical protein n=1 Tax=Daejeonia sp. YH14 TaxID=3439042 RepID=UPI003F49A6C5
MDKENFNKAENAVDKTENALREGAQNVKNKVSDLADKARDYIREQKSKNETPTREGWFATLKDDLKDGWDDMKDTASDAWESFKDWGEDAKAEIRKKTN